MHVRTSATASLAGLATRMMTAMLAMDITQMLGMSQMLASFVVDMTAVLTGSATPTLAGFSFAKNLLGVNTLLRLVMQILISFVNTSFGGLFPMALLSASVFVRRAALSVTLAVMVCLMTLHGLLLRR
jgi:hypothetical protein